MDNMEINKTKRNCGIDLLKSISMFMVVVLHICGRGGVLEEAKEFSLQYEIAWLIEIMAYCAVNCYALISGYVGYGRKIKYSNIIYLYLQVNIYTLIITILFAILSPGVVGVKDFIKAIFPVFFGVYWYFTAYFCMFFFLPYINIFLEKTDKNILIRLIVTIFLIYIITPTLFHYDFGISKNGYSAIWVALLYIIGAFIKKYDLTKKFKMSKCVMAYTFSVFISFVTKYMIEIITNKFLGRVKGGAYLISYTSPTIVLCAVSLLCIFSEIKLKDWSKKIIGLFSAVSFGVYIIHTNPLIFNNVLKDAFKYYAEFNPIMMVIAIIGTAFLIWLGCSIIDMVRLLVFNLLKIKEKCIWLENKMKDICKKCV